MKTRLFAPLALVLLAPPQTAVAAIVTYTDQAAFLAAISSSGVDSFNSLPDFTLVPSPLTRSAGSFGYTATAPSNFFSTGSAADIWLSANRAAEPITLDSFTGGVFSLGGQFFGSDYNGAYVLGDITVSVQAGSTTASQTITAATTASFLGFVSDTALTQATVTAIQPASDFMWPTINNLTLGGSAVAAVPEPATWAMMIVGFGVIGTGLRRKGRMVRARFVPN